MTRRNPFPFNRYGHMFKTATTWFLIMRGGGEGAESRPAPCAALWRVGCAAYAMSRPRAFGALLRGVGGSVNKFRTAPNFGAPSTASRRARSSRKLAKRPA